MESQISQQEEHYFGELCFLFHNSVFTSNAACFVLDYMMMFQFHFFKFQITKEFINVTDGQNRNNMCFCSEGPNNNS